MKQIKSQVDGETAENQEQPLAKLNKSETINYFSSYWEGFWEPITTNYY